MEPIEGIEVVREFGDRFEADLAIAALRDAGLPAVAVSDGLLVASPFPPAIAGYRVAVRHEDVEAATALLDAYDRGDRAI